MLTVQDFMRKIIEDFKREFSEVKIEKGFIRLGTGITNIELPIESMYMEYKVVGYDSVKDLYLKVANDILNQYKFRVDYNNVYPLLKNKDFGEGKDDLKFYRERTFADIDTLYVSDEGEVFRYVLETDDVDFEKVKKSAWENLNKLSNVLVQLDGALKIFCLHYTTDFNASFLLSDSVQKQIAKKVGQDYLFAIPSSTTLIVARYRPEYISIIKSLMAIDTDTNRISDKVYQYKNGIFDIASV